MPQRTNEAIWLESRGQWQIKVQRDGIRKTFTSTTPGRKGKLQAERRADEWLKSNMADGSIRFQKLWDGFLDEIQKTTGTANYEKHDQMGRRWLLPKLKHKRVGAITRQDYQDCINAGAAAGLSKRSCENIRLSISAVYNYALNNSMEMANPRKLKIPTGAPVGERNILQPDDLKTLFSEDTITHYRREHKCFYIYAWRLIVLLGLRRGEACGLQRQDIEGKVLHIKRSINSKNEETRGKNENAQRYIVLGKRAASVLEDQADMLKATGIISPWVFPDEYGDRSDPNRIYKQWLTYRTQHGIKSSIHEMRHTFVSVAKADMPETLLKRVIGHSKSMDTFGTYGHDVDGELERAANIADGIFDNLLQE